MGVTIYCALFMWLAFRHNKKPVWLFKLLVLATRLHAVRGGRDTCTILLAPFHVPGASETDTPEAFVQGVIICLVASSSLQCLTVLGLPFMEVSVRIWCIVGLMWLPALYCSPSYSTLSFLRRIRTLKSNFRRKASHLASLQRQRLSLRRALAEVIKLSDVSGRDVTTFAGYKPALMTAAKHFRSLLRTPVVSLILIRDHLEWLPVSRPPQSQPLPGLYSEAYKKCLEPHLRDAMAGHPLRPMRITRWKRLMYYFDMAKHLVVLTVAYFRLLDAFACSLLRRALFLFAAYFPTWSSSLRHPEAESPVNNDFFSNSSTFYDTCFGFTYSVFSPNPTLPSLEHQPDPSSDPTVQAFLAAFVLALQHLDGTGLMTTDLAAHLTSLMEADRIEEQLREIEDEMDDSVLETVLRWKEVKVERRRGRERELARARKRAARA
ncbi:hypothetical protein JCM10207_007305 [Rhodosporidiobolus poonsookiae]